MLNEYGTESKEYNSQTAMLTAEESTPIEILIEKLKLNTRYYYHIRYREFGADLFAATNENTFITQRDLCLNMKQADILMER